MRFLVIAAIVFSLGRAPFDWQRSRQPPPEPMTPGRLAYEQWEAEAEQRWQKLLKQYRELRPLYEPLPARGYPIIVDPPGLID